MLNLIFFFSNRGSKAFFKVAIDDVIVWKFFVVAKHWFICVPRYLY